ncbi:ABC transporter ATP-binding protein [Falsirhodobacter sp. 20TX0035]|uniref:ABC transporter ATP-binding protein n=1 Tax=Falsirhodobacter sp. 20TX0035 TaxID=3022019 RepID=UPI00232C11D1|nr:ABC transporter ATP-binding protein [Falsirhodobacter sp. 20TX0035]MDB6452893.1 ABC transporter ATP-binding protein [Falsirhodobacter sp. 20TX0035]
MMHLHKLTVRRGRRVVLDGVDLSLNAGEFAALLGPNGAGKTTLLRAALGLLPATGHSSVAALPLAGRARAAAFLPQTRDIAWPMPVADIVALGGVAQTPDPAQVEQALTALDLLPLRHRPATELSGGEQARVLIARALAQDTPLLLADEPIAGLDPAAQIAAMRVFARRAAAGRTVLASLHDPGLAARHCTRLILMKGGRIHADGPPMDVLTADNLAQVFGIRAHVTEGPHGPIFQALDLAPPRGD